MNYGRLLLLSCCWLLAAVAGLWWLLDHSPEPRDGQVRRIQFNSMSYLLWPNGQITPDIQAERAFALNMQAASAEFYMQMKPSEPTLAPPAQ